MTSADAWEWRRSASGMAFAVGPALGLNRDVRKRSRRVAPQCCDNAGLYRRNRERMSPEEYNSWRQDIRKRSLAIPLVVDYDPIDVVYEDDELIAVAKPADLKVHPAHRFVGGTLINRVNGYLGYPPKTLHRLDQSTSGVVLMGKRKGPALSEISRSFRDKEVTKEYLAVVEDPEGLYEKQSLVVDAPICRDDRELFMRKVGWDGPEAKEGRTRIDFLDRIGKVALVRAVPITGRTHQIRVHLQHIGCPILGDPAYGFQGPWITTGECQVRVSLHLHAWKLHFPHPCTQQRTTATAEPPENFQATADYFNLTLPSGSLEDASLLTSTVPTVGYEAADQ